MTPFRVVESTTRWRSGFLALDEARVEGPDGQAFTRSIVRHPGAVVVVAIDGDGRALLVRQYRAAVDGELLEVVAGKRDVDGEAPAVTARRELEEEIGRHAERLVALCEFYNSPGFTDEHTHLFVALDLTEVDGPRGVTEEEAAMSLEHVDLDDIEDLIARGTLVDAKSIIGLLLTRRFLAGEFAGTGS